MSLVRSVLDKPALEHLPGVEAPLNYLVPMAEKPVNYTYKPPTGIPRQSGTYASHTLPIRDARSIVPNLSLDREGFALVVHDSGVQDFYNDEEICRVYYPEAEQLLAEVTGAFKVIVFDHNVRDAEKAEQGLGDIKEPVLRVHNDFTAQSGYSRARAVLTALGIEDAELLLQHRFSVINVWRPIAPVQKSPLAVCDAQSIAVTDWVASDLVYRDRVGETYSVTYNPNHHWFYFPHMHPNEALLIKCFDSSKEGHARFAAHTAFNDPTSSPKAPPRKSIELRTLVFYLDS